MNEMHKILGSIGTGLLSLLAFAFGGLTKEIYILGAVMGLDVFTGVLIALRDGVISSKIGKNGTFTKIGMLVGVIAAYVFDLIFNTNGVFKAGTILLLTMYESISVVENLEILKVPLPVFVKKRLLIVKNQIEQESVGKNNENSN